ncbi:hypothetical protein [Streptosporangium amethystogenes]|uniref:MmyB family transcriptional regulator n=1 Tax=Streptosporangium amethystogenes TaxID=2002 RepID=UPI00146FEF0E|nr:hypothetical protein [Streptosporangium amethystogenes]
MESSPPSAEDGLRHDVPLPGRPAASGSHTPGTGSGARVTSSPAGAPESLQQAGLPAATAGSQPGLRRECPPPTPAPAHEERPGLQRMLDVMTDAPAIIRDSRMDLLAANHLSAPCTGPSSHLGHFRLFRKNVVNLSKGMRLTRS